MGVDTGKRRPWSELPVSNQQYTEAVVVIIGGGISGICLAIDLLKANIRNFIILEKSTGFGGTWRDNKFPGSCCDVWSHLYSYSFEQSAHWTRAYPGQEELLDYLMGVADKHHLPKHARFNTAVEKAEWDDRERKWKTTVRLGGGKDSEFGDSYVITSDFLAPAVGQLNVPMYPDLPGLDSFKGKVMHSARWDWGYSMTGKKVAIFGATAAQIVPEVAKVAAHLTVMQRSPGWVVPRHDAAVPGWKRMALRIPLVRRWYRAWMMDIREGFFHAVTNNTSPAALHMRQLNHDLKRTSLPDRPDMWAKLSPNYSPGCKRSVISDDYYPALNRPNVALETRALRTITAGGLHVEGEDLAQQYDAIILATGFRTSEFMYPIKVVGRKGRSLDSIWADSAKAYKGITVEDLPNFGMLYGPNTNLSHNSLILVIEAQSRYIATMVREVVNARVRGMTLALTPKSDVVKRYNEALQKRLQATSFADPNCTSWWKDKDTGIIANNWAGNAVEYQKNVSKVDWSDFEAEGSAAHVIRKKKSTSIGRVIEETTRTQSAVALSTLSIIAMGLVALFSPKWLWFVFAVID